MSRPNFRESTTMGKRKLRVVANLFKAPNLHLVLDEPLSRNVRDPRVRAGDSWTHHNRELSSTGRKSERRRRAREPGRTESERGGDRRPDRGSVR
jgi:hypothetical protein